MPRSRILPCLALVLMSLDARAIGIGEIIAQPRLGERLRIELRLHADDQPVDPSCIRLAPAESADDLPWIRSARLRVQGGARPTLVVESNEVINHPIYMLGLRIGCGAEVRREFAMMPQPPLELPRGTPAAAPTTADPGAPMPATSPRASGTGWLIVEGETLSSIAEALYPGDAASQRSFVRRAARANPRLFRGVADPASHALPGGESLALPGTGAAAPARTAHEWAARAPARTRKPRVEEASPAVAQAPARDASARRGEDRLSVASGEDGEAGLKFSTLLDDARSRGLTEEQRERLRQEQRLIAQLDEKIIASLALAEKIRNMEDYLEKLQGDMARLDQQIRGAADAGVSAASISAAPSQPGPALAAKAPAPRTVEDEGLGWQSYTLMAGVLALAGFVWWRRREAPIAEEPAEPELELAPPETEMPAAAEPTLAQQVPTRIEVSPALELDLEQPDHEESKVAVAEHDSALELAEIMLSFGRVQGAAQTLTDYIAANPRQAIRPWLKLLEIYHGAGMQKEFAAVMDQFHQNFNVQKVGWADYPGELARNSVEGMPHLMQEVVASWPSRGCLELLQNYLRDNREGTRTGFPLAIADDIAMLVGILESRHIPAQAA